MLNHDSCPIQDLLAWHSGSPSGVQRASGMDLALQLGLQDQLQTLGGHVEPVIRSDTSSFRMAGGVSGQPLMATLLPPSIDNATSETSPLLPPENGSLARGDIVDERLVG